MNKNNQSLLFIKKYIDKILQFERFDPIKLIEKKAKVSPNYLINYLIDRKEKSEIILKYIQICECEKEINHKYFIKSIMINETSIKILINSLKIYPEESTKCINYYIKNNNQRIALNIYKDLKLNDPLISEKIEILNKRSFANRLIYNLLDNKTDIETVIEFFKEDNLMLKFIFNRLIKKKLYEEAIFLLFTSNNGNSDFSTLFELCDDDLISELLMYLSDNYLDVKALNIDFQKNKIDFSVFQEGESNNLTNEEVANNPDSIKDSCKENLNSLLELLSNKLEKNDKSENEIKSIYQLEKTNENNNNNIIPSFDSLDDFIDLNILEILKCKSNSILSDMNFCSRLNQILSNLGLEYFSNKTKAENFKENNLLIENSEEYFILPLTGENIIYIDSLEQLNLMKEKFEKSKYLGIDSEWKPNTNILTNQEITSIIQISDKNTCFIIDYLNLIKQEKFVEKFIEIFTSKTFLAYSFESDIKNFRNNQLSDFFRNNKVIDFRDIFDGKSIGEKVYGLSNLCYKLLGKKINKKNQLTNWASRPLKKEQIYYAALDAYVLTEIFDVMVNNKKFKSLISV